VSPFYFDGSFGTLFPTLFVGGVVVIRPRESLLFPRTFFNAILRECITYTGFSPSYLKLLLSNPQMAKLRDSTLNIVALGGEAGSVADIRALWEAAPAVRVFNRYGPTETTIAVTHIELTPELVADGTVPISISSTTMAFRSPKMASSVNFISAEPNS
jgi:D-alanine--poly(phosphoribitol) ligase subunit 1